MPLIHTAPGCLRHVFSEEPTEVMNFLRSQSTSTLVHLVADAGLTGINGLALEWVCAVLTIILLARERRT